MNKIYRGFRALFTAMLLMAVVACSNMPITDNGFLLENNVSLNSNSKKIVISWQLENSKTLADEDKQLLSSSLNKTLTEKINSSPFKKQFDNIQVRAAITRVETVSVPLNLLTTVLVFLPLDRGGAAVEFEAVDLSNGKIISQLNFSQWTPMTEFLARFSRLDPSEIALKSAAEDFIDKLQQSFPAS